MDKKNIKILEDVKGLIEDMYFKDLKGGDLFGKVFLIQEFLKLIKEAKEPLKPVGKPTPIEEDKPKKKRKKKEKVDANK